MDDEKLKLIEKISFINGVVYAASWFCEGKLEQVLEATYDKGIELVNEIIKGDIK